MTCHKHSYSSKTMDKLATSAPHMTALIQEMNLTHELPNQVSSPWIAV